MKTGPSATLYVAGVNVKKIRIYIRFVAPRSF